MTHPKLHRIGQMLNTPVVPDVAAAARDAIRGLPVTGRLRPGGRAAVIGGCRGVGNIATVYKVTYGMLSIRRQALQRGRGAKRRRGGSSMGHSGVIADVRGLHRRPRRHLRGLTGGIPWNG